MSLPSEPSMLVCYQPSLPILDTFPAVQWAQPTTGTTQRPLNVILTRVYTLGDSFYICVSPSSWPPAGWQFIDHIWLFLLQLIIIIIFYHTVLTLREHNRNVGATYQRAFYGFSFVIIPKTFYTMLHTLLFCKEHKPSWFVRRKSQAYLPTSLSHIQSVVFEYKAFKWTNICAFFTENWPPNAFKWVALSTRTSSHTGEALETWPQTLLLCLI